MLEDDDEDFDLDWKSRDKEPPVRREFLKPRDYRVSIDLSIEMVHDLNEIANILW